MSEATSQQNALLAFGVIDRQSYPSPLVGEVREGGGSAWMFSFRKSSVCSYPPPRPSPTRGEGVRGAGGSPIIGANAPSRTS